MLNFDAVTCSALSRRQLLRTFCAGSVLVPSLRRAWCRESASELPFTAVQCDGRYQGHLQGVCSDDQSYLYWSFTTQIVKTDVHGRIVQQVKAPNHQGDLCWRSGQLYVAVNLGKFNRPAGAADSWVSVYDGESLKERHRYPVPEVVHGAGGMDARGDRFYVVGGLPEGASENYAYEYDNQFRFLKRHTIASGYTLMGIQTAAFHAGCWWFGCYGKPAVLLKTDANFQLIGKWNFNAALGLIGHSEERFLVARGGKADGLHTARIVPAMADSATGMKLVETT